jgi:hypothetical protein
MKLLYWCIIQVFILTACTETPKTQSQIEKQKNYSFTSELKIFQDIGALPQYLDNTFTAQISTYDTTWKNDDGFNGKYSFLKRNTDSSLVIFDVKGSGVINRIWTPTPTDDTLDFFIDTDQPTFSIKYADLFSGQQFPFVSPLCGNQLGGFYCYLPIPFEKHCKIISRGKKMQFHQIQYRLFERGSKVKSFSLDLNAEERQVLEAISLLWNKEKKSIQNFYSAELSKTEKQFQIQPGETTTVFETKKGGRIVGIEIEPAEAFEGLNKNVDLKITWDNEKHPAVFCPVADFFGYAFGSPSMQSLLLGTQGATNYCYFPMPFDESAKIELINRNTKSAKSPININVKVWYLPNKRASEREGKFYAYWNKNATPEKGKPHVFLNVKGKGHYVGTILQAQGMKAGMTLFFEGDDSTAIDGSFRMHGTGSEDYFNGGWYAMLDRWDSKMSLPLHGALDYSLPFARTGGYRLFLSDKLSFEKSLYHSIEHGPVSNAFPVDYTSVGLYYSDSPVTASTQPTSQLTTVFIPDTLIIYPQLMNYNLAGNMDVRTSWKYGTGGESYLFTGSNESWIRIALTDIPQGTYRLTFDVNEKPDGCDFSVWQRQTKVSSWISTNHGEEERVKDLFICDLDIRDFKNTITIRFKSDREKSSLLLHRMTLIRK